MMTVPKGKRAAYRLVSGRAYEKVTSTTLRLTPGLIALAIQYQRCSPSGRDGSKSISEYVDGLIVEDLREYEKERLLNPVNTGG